MAVPTLLLRPEGSRDRNGPVTPLLSAGVTIVPGQFGNAWQNPSIGWTVLHTPAGAWRTVIVRGATSTTFIGTRQILNTHPIEGVVWIRRPNPTSMSFMVNDGQNHTDTINGASSGSYTASLRIFEGSARGGLFTGSGHQTALIEGLNTLDMQPDLKFGWRGVVEGVDQIESILIYDTALTDAEIERISTMPTAWTWESLMPKIGGVLRSHSLAPFAVAREHSPAPFALRATHKEL